MTIEIYGHRGCRGLLPENTLPAFAHALELGVDGFELDCALTKDRVVVVTHDAALSPEITRDESGRWLPREGPAIWDLTYNELRRYDVGRIDPRSEYAQRFPRQQPFDGARVPRLADVFALVNACGAAHVRVNLEAKLSPLDDEKTATADALIDAMVSVVRDCEMERRVWISSFDRPALAIARERAPHIAIGCLTAEQKWLDNVCRRERTSSWTAPDHVSDYGGALPRMAHAVGASVWSPYFEEATAASVREAHALRLRVIVWTVNDERDMRRMIEIGVDGIISDYPDLLTRVARSASA